MIDANDIAIRYGQAVVLEGLCLRVRPGERVGIVGASGSGKSSLLRIAAGLQKPSSGAWQNGFQRIGIAFQQPTLLPWRTARDNLVIPLLARGHTPEQAQQLAQQWLARVGLAEHAQHWPAKLSGGMAQRLSLARALSVEPDLLLLDEPFSALDPALRQALIALARTWLEESSAALLCISHHPEELSGLVHRTLALSDRRARWVEH